MADSYIASVELRVPNHTRSVGVTPDWSIEVNGQLQDRYSADEALVFSTLCQQKDRILPIDYIPPMVFDTYSDAVRNGAKTLPVIENRPSIDVNTGVGIRKVRLRSLIERLQSRRLGPLATNVYQLRFTSPISIFLCTDVSSANYGLDIIRTQKGNQAGDHLESFLGRYESRMQEEVKWVSSSVIERQKPKLVKLKANSDAGEDISLIIRPKKVEVDQPSAWQMPISETSGLSLEEINKQKLLSLLESPVGTTISTGTFNDDLLEMGFIRRDLETVFRSLDNLVKMGYLNKKQDPNNSGHAIYVRSSAILRKKS